MGRKKRNILFESDGNFGSTDEVSRIAYFVTPLQQITRTKNFVFRPMKIIGEVPQNSGLLRIVPMRRPYSIISPSVDAFRRLGFESWKKQETLLLQRDCARHLAVEILQLQNISLENPVVWHYLRDSTFSRFDTIPECDRHTHRQMDRHTTTAYTTLSIASCGKNRPYCTAHQL